MKQPSAERYETKPFFTNNFVNFQKILAAHPKNFPKMFRTFKEKHPWQSLILVKLQALQKQLPEVFCKKWCS